MSHQMTFTHTVRVVDIEGSLLVLPDQTDRDLLQAQLQNARDEALAARGRLDELTAQPIPEDKEEAETHAEKVIALTDEVTARDAACLRIEGAVSDLDAFLAKCEPLATQLEFGLHRWSYLERAAALEGARIIVEFEARIDEPVFIVGILGRCIDSWPYEGKPSAEAVGALSPQIVENLHRRLVKESSPSPARLQFPRTPSDGPTRRKPSKASRHNDEPGTVAAVPHDAVAG